VVRRSEYEELDLDAKVELIRELIPLGLMHIQELLVSANSRNRAPDTSRSAARSNGNTLPLDGCTAWSSGGRI
jgi:hypothetical protein